MTEDEFCTEVEKHVKHFILPSLDVTGEAKPTSDFIVRHLLNHGPSCPILKQLLRVFITGC